MLSGATITDAAGRVTTYTYDALGRLVRTTDPSGAITQVAYDAADNVVKVTDPNGLHTTYVYDGFGQLWAQSSPDTGLTSVQYDAAGRRTSVTRNDGTTLGFQYDTLGRVTYIGDAGMARFYSYDWCQNGLGQLCGMSVNDAQQVLSYSDMRYTPEGLLEARRESVGGMDLWTGYAYDSQGRLTGLSYPSGVSVGYGYANGKLTTMTAVVGGTTQVVAGSINYEPFAGISSWTYGNNVARTYAYDLDGRVTGVWAGRAGNDPIQGLFYRYDAQDQITGITNGMVPTLSQDHGYDAAGRLVAQTMNGATMGLAYDGTGNRTQRNDAGAVTAYAYAAGSHRLQSANSASLARQFTANALGNLTSWTGADGVAQQMSYDTFQRPATHTRNGITTAYRFNAQDQRVMKSQAGGTVTHRYAYAGQNTLLA